MSLSDKIQIVNFKTEVIFRSKDGEEKRIPALKCEKGLKAKDVKDAVKELIRMIELENLNVCVGKFSNRTIEYYIKSIFGEKLT